jgi:hypothetical protein
MKVDFISGVQGRITNSSAHKCQNFFPAIDKLSQKPYALLGTPGLKDFSDTGHTAEARGTHVFGDYLYAVVGDKFFKVDSAGTATEQTGTLSTSTGRVWMANNLTQIMIVDGVKGYIYESGTLTAIADTDLPVPTSLAHQDGYFICTIEDSDAFYISAIEDGTSWDALDFASAEAQPDFSKAILSDHRELVIFGDDTTEFFHNTGNADFPFERVSGAYIERGILSGLTACKLDNSLFWLDNNGQVQKVAGYTPQIISDRSIEYQIAKMTTVSDAHAYAYVQEGHSFYVLVFPSEDKAFAYDVESGMWHTRTSGYEGYRHRGNCYALFNNKRIIGDYENGKLYEYDFDTYDGNQAIARARVTHPEGYSIFHYSLEVEFESGVGLITGDATDPDAILRYSDDHGKTWSSELWRKIGKIGEYEHRSRWNKLGRSKDRIYEIILPGQHRRVIIGATLKVAGGKH